MKYKSFKELEETYSSFSDVDKYMEALDVLERGVETLSKDEFEKHEFSIMMDKFYFYYQCEMYEKLFDALAYMIGKGFVCPLYWFDDLREQPRYMELKEKNDLLLIDAQRKAKFEYKVYLPKGYTNEKKYPLLFSLHGDGDNISYHNRYWNEEYLVSKGFIVVYIQSPQVIRHDGYVWIKKELYLEKSSSDDKPVRFNGRPPETYSSIHDDIKTCYDSLINQYSIDREKIIVSGFSGGALGAIDIALGDIIPIKGVIALCSLKPKSFTSESVNCSFKRGTRWVFMEGEEDIPVKDVEEMKEEFNRIGVPYEYYINKGIGHFYPDDLDNNLEKALKFIGL